MNLELLLEKARRTNARRDAEDRAAEEPTLAELPLSNLLDTAYVALEAGVVTESWDFIGEGLDMLRLARERVDDPGKMRQQIDIQQAHDMLWPLVMDKALSHALTTKGTRLLMIGALNALCWVLHHDDDPTFEKSLDAVRKAYIAIGMRAKEPKQNPEKWSKRYGQPEMDR